MEIVQVDKAAAKELAKSMEECSFMPKINKGPASEAWLPLYRRVADIQRQQRSACKPAQIATISGVVGHPE